MASLGDCCMPGTVPFAVANCVLVFSHICLFCFLQFFLFCLFYYARLADNVHVLSNFVFVIFQNLCACFLQLKVLFYILPCLFCLTYLYSLDCSFGAVLFLYQAFLVFLLQSMAFSLFDVLFILLPPVLIVCCFLCFNYVCYFTFVCRSTSSTELMFYVVIFDSK